jgi:hypothetical protein
MQVLLPDVYEDQLARSRGYYERRGYSVRLQPSGTDLPDFLRGAHPDLIAERDSQHILAEIKIPKRIRRVGYWQWLDDVIKSHPGWRLDVILPGPDELVSSSHTEVTADGIIEYVGRLGALEAKGETNAAFLLAWTVFEAAMRIAINRDGLKPQSTAPSALVTLALDEGYIDYDEYDRLMVALDERNRILHGISFEPVNEDIVADLVKAIHVVLAAPDDEE